MSGFLKDGPLTTIVSWVPFLGLRLDSFFPQGTDIPSPTYPHENSCEAPAQPVKDIESQETGHRNEVISWQRRKRRWGQRDRRSNSDPHWPSPSPATQQRSCFQPRERQMDPGSSAWVEGNPGPLNLIPSPAWGPVCWDAAVSLPQALVPAMLDLTSAVTAGNNPMVTVKMKHTESARTEI